MLLKSVHYFHFSTLLDIETKKNKTTIYCVFIESDVIIMMGKQHLTFGLATGVITIFTLKELGFTEVWNNSFCLLTFTGLGSLLPDIDYPYTTLGKKVKPISNLLYKTIGHRTYTHDLFLMIIIMALSIYKYNNIFMYFLWLGILGHLFLDSLTAKGIPFLYLFNKKNIHLTPYRFRFNSNSFRAKIITIFFCFLYGYINYCILKYLDIPLSIT